MEFFINFALGCMVLVLMLWFGGCLLNLLIVVVLGVISAVVMAGNWLWTKARYLFSLGKGDF